ncbi:MAG: CoA transferase [Rhizobiaceae bacterium]|nr:CoA transferase [Rhizobiaceae bacterium]
MNADFPLDGLRVVELGSGSESVMLCGRMLAELGAHVILIEPPAGHPLRRQDDAFHDARAPLFGLYSRGKHSAVVDFEDMEAMKDLKGLLGKADVVLLDKSGHSLIDSHGWLDDITAVKSLVLCCISPFGLAGPYANMSASELIVQSLAGVLQTNGQDGEEPVAAGIPIAAYGGAFYGLIAILSALYKRLDVGSGDVIDQSEFDAVFSFLGTILPGYLLTGEDFERVGNRHTMTAPWNNYPTRNGWVAISTVGDHQWQALASAMGRAEWGTDERFLTNPDRVRNVEELDRLISEWTASIETAELLTALDAANVPASAVLSLAEAIEDEHAKYRIVRRRGDDAMPMLPFRLERSAAWRWGEYPELGAGTLQWQAAKFPSGDRPGESGQPPLSGVKVVDVGILTAGPLSARILGMLGADVFKVEPPEGERTRRVANQIAGAAYLYHLNNTDKFGVTFGATSADGTPLFSQLCKTADVFVSNIGDQALAKMGVGPEDRETVNDRLIYCTIGGFGRSGPKRGRKTFDMVIQAQTGIMAVTGSPSGAPTKVALSIVDLMSALSATAGVVAALIARKRYGYGQQVESCLFDVGLWMTQSFWPEIFQGNLETPRLGNRSPYSAPHGCFATRDGAVSLAVITDRQWRAWAELAGRADLADSAEYRTSKARVARAEQLERIVADWAAKLSTADVVDMCQRAHIPAAEASTLQGVVNHPLTSVRELLMPGKNSAGDSFSVIGAPMKFSRSAVSVKRMAPQLGEHNQDLREMLEVGSDA